MVLPYQAWMLQRLLPVLDACTATEAGESAIHALLEPWPGHERFLDLERALRGCRLRKDGGRLFAEEG